MAPMAELPTGSLLAGCRIEGIVGRGGMGVVYRATQLSLERPVALKVIAPDFAGDITFRERFKRESRIAASIEHPNVIPVYEAGEGEGQLYLIMRYVEGTDLRAVIDGAGSGLPPERATQLVAQVAAGLAAAHRRDLIHRDVKPANVLIDAGGEREHAYLTDFGIARHSSATSGLTHTGALIGTMDYLAPERIQDQGATAAPTSTPSAAFCSRRSPGRGPTSATTTWPRCTPTSARRCRRPSSCAPTCRRSWTSWPSAQWPRIPTTASRAPARCPRR